MRRGLEFRLKGWIAASVGLTLRKKGAKARGASLFRGANEKGKTMTILGKAVSALFVASILGTLVLMVAPDIHASFCAVVR